MGSLGRDGIEKRTGVGQFDVVGRRTSRIGVSNAECSCFSYSIAKESWVYSTRFWIVFSLAITLATVVGCDSGGPEVNYVRGTVTLDGAPLPGATVNFSPVAAGSGQAAVGVTDENGVYELTDMQSDEYGSGAATGQYQVAIVKNASDATENYPEPGDPGYFDVPDANDISSPKSEVPAKYSKAGTSGLKATVKAGTNENVDFAIVSTE